MEFTGKLTPEILEDFITRLNEYPFPGKPKDFIFYTELLKTKVRVAHRYTKNLHPTARQPYYAESLWGFIDLDGNIYKGDTWNRAAKHIRGSVFSPDPFKAHTWMGVRYLK